MASTLGSIGKYIKDVSVLRRLLFAVSQLPQDMPNKWGIAVEFATQGKEGQNQITAEQVKVFMENMNVLDTTAFQNDNIILKNLLNYEVRVRLIIRPSSQSSIWKSADTYGIENSLTCNWFLWVLGNSTWILLGAAKLLSYAMLYNQKIWLGINFWRFGEFE